MKYVIVMNNSHSFVVDEVNSCRRIKSALETGRGEYFIKIVTSTGSTVYVNPRNIAYAGEER